MKKVLLVAVFFGYFFISSNTVQAETLKIYPTDDAMAQLFDTEMITEWDIARNFSGLISKPISTELPDAQGKLALRSDKASGFYRIYRVSTNFDLATLPSDATILSAKLHLYKSSDNNAGNVEVVAVSHNREDISLYQVQDWGIGNFGEVEFSRRELLDGQYTVFDFGQSGLDYLNQISGDATIGLLTHFDFDNQVPTGFIQAATWYSLENPGTDFDPYLEIEYEVEGQLTYEQFLEILEAELEGYSAQQKAFFMMWAEKIFSNMEEKTVEQALKSIKVYKKLLVAKKIKSPLLKNIFDHLHKSSKER